MKKVILVVLAVMLATVFLTAAAPPLKLLRLTIINKSGNEVYLKLEGSDIGGQFYYLTIPAGTKEWPHVVTFTVLSDIYDRTTWYGPGDFAECEGVSSSGQLVMDRNNRLTFTTCNARSLTYKDKGADVCKSIWKKGYVDEGKKGHKLPDWFCLLDEDKNPHNWKNWGYWKWEEDKKRDR